MLLLLWWRGDFQLLVSAAQAAHILIKEMMGGGVLFLRSAYPGIMTGSQVGLVMTPWAIAAILGLTL
jgi:hypothetical protein